MFVPKKRAEDEAEDRNAAKPQLKKALYRRVGVSAYRRRSRTSRVAYPIAVPNSSC